MNALFKRLMGDATRLTQAGDLQGAAKAIQAAFHDLSAPAAMPAARPVDPALDPLVVDVQARVVPESPAAATAPQARTSAHTGAVGQFISGSHTDAAGTRVYKLFVPPNPSGQPLPLVVMLHGCTQDPDDFAAGTGMNDAALAQGAYVLYPAQTQQANAQRCWNWFKHSHQQRGRGEPALLAGMTRAVMAEHAVDPQRVYVAGLSAGGAMAAILGDAYPELFAAVGVHSGLATGAASDVGSAFAAMQGGTVNLPASSGLSGLPGMGGARVPGGQRPARLSSAPPTIVFHGDKDSTVHPVNGEHVMSACLEPGPAGVKTCQPAQAERGRSSGGRAYTRQVHRDADGHVLAEHWVVHGAGHAWAGGRAKGSYTDPQGPDATQEMLRFFLACPPTATP